MSNRPLLNMVRGGLRDFHVGADRADRADRDAGLVRFGGERRDRVAAHYTFSMHATREDKHDYSKKENREVTSKKRSKDGDGSTTGDESGSDDEGSKKKPTRLYKRGEDADTGEGKGPKNLKK
jgi:hypothetical protein